jgi:hypothetical protein
MAYMVDEEEPTIYSPSALFWFCVFFGPLAGGIMAYQSLQTVDRLTTGKYTLWASIGCFLLLWVANLPGLYPIILSVATGIMWGTGLCYLFKKQVPSQASLPRKSVGPPLRICLYVVAAFIILTCARIQLGL